MFFFKESYFQKGSKKKKSQISKETDTVDEGIVYEISEAQTWKEQSSKSSVEFVVALFQVAKESPCPLRLLGLLTSSRWEVSWQMSHAGTRHKIRK